MPFKTKARKVKIDNIQFQSLLEADFYKKAKKANLPFKYEKLSFTLLDETPMEFGDYIKKHGKKLIHSSAKIQAIKYTPDFTLKIKEIDVIIECKGNPNERYPIVRKLFLKHMENKGKPYKFYEPRSKLHNDFVIEEIKQLWESKKKKKNTTS